MKYKKDDKLVCIKDIDNMLGNPLFKKGEIYTILYISADKEDITLNHILYGNEYGILSEEYLDKNFISLKESRKQKLKKIQNYKSLIFFNFFNLISLLFK